MADYNRASNVEKVINGETIVKDKSLISKILAHAGTDTDDLMTYLINDVAVPKLKDLLSDLVDKGSKRIIYGKSNVRSASGNGVTYNYNGISSKSSTVISPSNRSTTVALTQSQDSYDDKSIILSDRVDAEKILNSLRGRIAEFGVASVSNLYQFMGRATTFTDRNWGWTNLDSADIVSVKEGWLLKLPKAKSLR